jgi:hypothetical protein
VLIELLTLSAAVSGTLLLVEVYKQRERLYR